MDFDLAHELSGKMGTFCFERCLTRLDFCITLTA